MNDQTLVSLGSAGSRFCPSPPAGVTLLGTIQDGLAVGALAQRADGRYVQLNGDYERELDTAAIEAILAQQGWRQSTAESGSTTGTPVVTIKRRRVPVMPTR
jgi:hypothetical protein